MKQTFALLSAAALAAALLAAPAAQAFTFQGQAPGDSGGAKNYVDPMDNVSPQAQDSGSHFDNRSTIPQQDGFYLNFNRNSEPGSFNQRYNANNLFDPYARDGR
jgi:hypothetical protein